MDLRGVVDLLEAEDDSWLVESLAEAARAYNPVMALLDALVEDDEMDDETRELYEAMEAYGPTRDFNPVDHPRGPDGAFIKKGSALGKLIDGLAKWDGKGDPWPNVKDAQLRQIAKKRGLTLKPDASREEIVGALVADLKDKFGKKPGAPDGKPGGDKKLGVLSPPTGKFELATDPGQSGDGYAPGGQWGKYGAAGIVIQSTAGDDEPKYLLVQRGPGVKNNQGKWQLPGGALHEKENPYQGAARETMEEVGADKGTVEGLTPVGEHVYTHDETGWQYTTLAASTDTEFEPKVDGDETADAKWFTATEIAEMQSKGELVPKLDSTLGPVIDSYPKKPKASAAKGKPGGDGSAPKVKDALDTWYAFGGHTDPKQGDPLEKASKKDLQAAAADMGLKPSSKATVADLKQSVKDAYLEKKGFKKAAPSAPKKATKAAPAKATAELLPGDLMTTDQIFEEAKDFGGPIAYGTHKTTDGGSLTLRVVGDRSSKVKAEVLIGDKWHEVPFTFDSADALKQSYPDVKWNASNPDGSLPETMGGKPPGSAAAGASKMDPPDIFAAAAGKPDDGIAIAYGTNSMGAQFRLVPNGKGGVKVQVFKEDTGAWKDHSAGDLAGPDELDDVFTDVEWQKAGPGGTMPGAAGAPDAGTPSAPKPPPAGAKKMLSSVTGGVEAYQVEATPEKGTWSTAKQTLDIYVDGEKIGKISYWYQGGPWTADSSEGGFVQGAKGKAGTVQALIAHHEAQKVKAGKDAAAKAAAADAAAKAAAADAKEKADKAAAKAATKASLKRSPNPTEAEAAVYGGDFSQLKRVGPQGGSNEGGVFEAPDGSRWYVKVQKSPEHASNEQAASAFYALAGIDVPEVYQGSGAPGLSGSHHTATRIVPDPQSDLADQIKAAGKGDKASRAYVRQAQEGFAVDAWLGNWDVAGSSYDNIVTSNGEPIRIDVGGALLFRAQGEPKGGAFGSVVSEWDKFRDTSSTKTSAALFDSMTPAQVVASAERLKAITPAKIRQTVKQHNLPPELADTLIERRKDILSRAKAEAKKVKAFGEGALEGNDAKTSVPVKLKGSSTQPNMTDALVSFGVPHSQASATMAATGHYKGFGYEEINGELLRRPEQKSNPTALKYVHDMDVAFEHSTLLQDVVVYRGERNPGRNFPPGEWSLVGGMEGKEWTFKAFASTSVDQHTADNFASQGTSKSPTAQPTVMRIVAPKGTRALDLGNEGEILLDRDLTYRVVADHGVDSGGIRRIDVMVVS